MTQIPRVALILGLAGVIPFAWGALTLVSEVAAEVGLDLLGPRFIGPFVQLNYGQIILSFMSGVLWGFATKARGDQAAIGYVLSVLPALWVFFTTGGGPVTAASNLILGYIGLLLLDFTFWRWGLTPAWWMHLRALLTALVVLCLSVGVLL